MSNFSDYFWDDSVPKQRAYVQFELTSTDEANLLDIEKSIANKKINKSNRKDLVDYLENLYRKVTEIKKNEYDYEGDSNLNVNEYLVRIKTLIMQIDKL